MHDMELWIFRIFGGIVVAVLIDYLLNFRTGLSEKYRLKSDCERISAKCHDENRQDHLGIFKKLDSINDQIVEIYKGIKRLNGNS